MTGDLVARLRAAGCVFAEEEADLLVASVPGGALEAAVRRRVAGEPLEHVLGFVDFAGDRYALSPGVFVPRQRTRALVDAAVAAVRSRPGGTLVDLCCGCGAVGLAVLRRLPGWRLTGADVDPGAVADARRNGAEAYVGDLFGGLPGRLRGGIDLLVVNAPYVPTGALAGMPVDSREHEPRRCVDGGADGMDLQRRVLREAPAWLAPGGVLLTETSRPQAEPLAGNARDLGYEPSLAEDPDAGAVVLRADRQPR